MVASVGFLFAPSFPGKAGPMASAAKDARHGLLHEMRMRRPQPGRPLSEHPRDPVP
jgi:hypothetical protein